MLNRSSAALNTNSITFVNAAAAIGHQQQHVVLTINNNTWYWPSTMTHDIGHQQLRLVFSALTLFVTGSGQICPLPIILM